MFTQICPSSALFIHFTMENPGLDSSPCPGSLRLCCLLTHSPEISAKAQCAVLGSSGFPFLNPPVHFAEYNDMHGVFGRGGRMKGLILGTLRDCH